MPAASSLSVLIVDDQAPFRTAIRRVLGRAHRLDVIGEAGADGGCARTQGNLLYTVATKVCCLSCVLFVLR